MIASRYSYRISFGGKEDVLVLMTRNIYISGIGTDIYTIDTVYKNR